MLTLLRIVSGGQTGVDRAALDAALQYELPAGGWCPENRVAEDGIIPSRYPLLELKGGSYKERTIKNILDSDGTALFYDRHPIEGTELTLLNCILKVKPYLLIDMTLIKPKAAAEAILQFLESHSVRTLNVAGPRASESAGGYDYTFQTFANCFSKFSEFE